MTAAIKILVVALSLAMDVFAVSVGVGVRGVPARDNSTTSLRHPRQKSGSGSDRIFNFQRA